MPLSKEHKQRSREHILDSAIRLFAVRGFNKVSIDQLMLDAGMTRGAFYAHFKSKEELYAQAMIAAANKSMIMNCDKNSAEFYKLIINGYLDMAHVKQETEPCALSFFVTDVANEKKEVRKVYTQIFKGLIQILASQHSEKNREKNSKKIMAIAAMMIGGVAVSRVLIDDDDAVEELLESCRSVAKKLVGY